MKSRLRIGTWSTRSAWLTLSLGFMITLGACQDAVAPLKPTEALSVPLRLTKSFVGSRKIANQYIVVLKDGVSGSAVRGQAKRLLQSPDQEQGFVYTSGLKGFSAHMTAAEAAVLANDPSVKYVEQDQMVEVTDVEPAAPSWGLDLIDQ